MRLSHPLVFHRLPLLHAAAEGLCRVPRPGAEEAGHPGVRKVSESRRVVGVHIRAHPVAEVSVKDIEEWLATPGGAQNTAMFEAYGKLKTDLAAAESRWEEAMIEGDNLL